MNKLICKRFLGKIRYKKKKLVERNVKFYEPNKKIIVHCQIIKTFFVK